MALFGQPLLLVLNASLQLAFVSPLISSWGGSGFLLSLTQSPRFLKCANTCSSNPPRKYDWNEEERENCEESRDFALGTACE